MSRNGILSAVGAYAIWGVLPVYWKAVQAVPAFEVLCHRTVWSFVFVILLLMIGKQQWEWLRRASKSPVTLLTFLVTACILGLNWFVYLWAVNVGRILDASLGYFVNPLISVLLGMLFLKERLRPWQWVAVAIAGAGVVFLTMAYGAFPWVALTLALTFAFYGLLRKTASLESLEGLAVETTILSLPSAAYLVYLGLGGRGAFGYAGAVTSFLLVLSGVATAFPLLLFTHAARKVTLATVGILQYIAPTGQFLLGVLVYGEAFSTARLVGFVIIWIALLVYSFEGVMAGKRQRAHTLSAG